LDIFSEEPVVKGGREKEGRPQRRQRLTTIPPRDWKQCKKVPQDDQQECFRTGEIWWREKNHQGGGDAGPHGHSRFEGKPTEKKLRSSALLEEFKEVIATGLREGTEGS